MALNLSKANMWMFLSIFTKRNLTNFERYYSYDIRIQFNNTFMSDRRYLIKYTDIVLMNIRTRCKRISHLSFYDMLI